MACYVRPGWGQASQITTVNVRPGGRVVLETAPCVVVIDPPPGGAVEVARVSDAKQYAVYNAPESLLLALAVAAATLASAESAEEKGLDVNDASVRFALAVSGDGRTLLLGPTRRPRTAATYGRIHGSAKFLAVAESSLSSGDR
jgi:hypothetical protein